jgi:prepilin-type N-terminal cleavage/methylation domain-containing protein
MSITNNKKSAGKSHPVSEGGFTLVEIAIVLMIIGVMMGGVLKGEELWRIAQTRRLFSDIQSVMAAIKGFQGRYDSAPGDFPLATTRIPNCTAASFCRNGNGDGRIGRTQGWGSGWNGDQTGTSTMASPHFYDETSQFWKHLAASKFLKNINPAANPAVPEWNQTHPGATTGGGFTVFTDTITAGAAIALRFQKRLNYGATGNLNAVDAVGQRPFTVKQAVYVDQKYDDGKAAAGYIWGIPYQGVGDPACRLSNGTYNMAQGDNLVCQQHFILH